MKIKDISAKVAEYPESNASTLKGIKVFGRFVVLKEFQCLLCFVILEMESGFPHQTLVAQDLQFVLSQ